MIGRQTPLSSQHFGPIRNQVQMTIALPCENLFLSSKAVSFVPSLVKIKYFLRNVMTSKENWIYFQIKLLIQKLAVLALNVRCEPLNDN